MTGRESAAPQVLVPYPGPRGDGTVQDIFVYLRPETNGVLVESLLLRVVQRCSQYHTGINLVYLANYPGQYIVDNHIVEHHYAHKIHFAVHGARAFTPAMRRTFEAHFRVPFSTETVIGSFQALQDLSESPEELFRHWVGPEELLHVNGQTVKRIAGRYIVNYDIPALMHKNNRGTDIAVMLFRCSVDYAYFQDLVNEMRASLVRESVLPDNLPASRAFHYSHGPFEQLLDAIGYLRHPGGEPVAFRDLSFVAYAVERGCPEELLRSVVDNPICLFDEGGAELVEESVFAYTATDTYPQALAKLSSLRGQLWIRKY